MKGTLRGGTGGGALALFAVAALAACGGGGGGGAQGGGQRTILASGGEGTAGDGGQGGGLILVGTIGADVEILAGGSIAIDDAPPPERPRLGANPRVVSADLTLTPDAEGRIPGSTDPGADATGLEVLAGVTLVLEATTTGTEPTFLTFDEGVVLAGEMRAGSTGLVLATGGLRVEETGRLVVAGEPAGQEADETPALDIESLGSIVNHGLISFAGLDGAIGGRAGDVEIACGGSLFNLGTIDASGGSGTTGAGGDAGAVVISLEDAAGLVLNAGTIAARGGNGATRGGAGGEIGFDGDLGLAALGGFASSGTLDVSGGAAGGVEDDRSGGDAGSIEVTIGGGDVRLAGRVLARGGDGFLGEGGSGGRGGFAAFGTAPVGVGTDLVRAEGSLLIGADFDVRGGRGARGGDAGIVACASFFAAQFLVEGAGGLDEEELLFLAATAPAGPSRITLAGYAGIDVSGGRSAGGRGGDAARLDGENEQVAVLRGLLGDAGVIIRGTSLGGQGGNVRNEVAITARGGDAVETDLQGGGEGGSGGSVELVKDRFGEGIDQEEATVINLARIDCSGGSGHTGGRAGAVGLADPAHIVNAGEVLLRGGDGAIGASLTGDGGGRGGVFVAVTSGLVEGSGAIRADGGAGTGLAGGRGGFIVVLGGRIQSGGELTATGGSGTIGGHGGGGEGFNFIRLGIADALLEEGETLPALDDFGEELDQSGGIVLASTNASSRVSGRLSVSGGAGSSIDGATGNIAIDGVDIDLEATGGVLTR